MSQIIIQIKWLPAFMMCIFFTTIACETAAQSKNNHSSGLEKEETQPPDNSSRQLDNEKTQPLYSPTRALALSLVPTAVSAAAAGGLVISGVTIDNMGLVGAGMATGTAGIIIAPSLGLFYVRDNYYGLLTMAIRFLLSLGGGISTGATVICHLRIGLL